MQQSNLIATIISLLLLGHVLFVGFQDGVEGEGDEGVALALVELALELHPVQPEGVEEGGEALHQHQDGDGE